MVSKKYEPYLLSAYQQINEHHRFQTQQNNQTITFYIVFISFFIGFRDSLSIFDDIIVNFIYIFVIVVGGIVILNMIQLRIWQLKYATAIQLVGSMFISDILIDSFSSFNQFIDSFECRSKTKHSLFAALTNKMIWGCTILSLAPFAMYFTFSRQAP